MLTSRVKSLNALGVLIDLKGKPVYSINLDLHFVKQLFVSILKKALLMIYYLN
jgi:hypothetical protein